MMLKNVVIYFYYKKRVNCEKNLPKSRFFKNTHNKGDYVIIIHGFNDDIDRIL